MNKKLSSTELSTLNIVSVKIEPQKRRYDQTIGGSIQKTISRTKYLKLCWFCGSPFESHKRNALTCSKRCSLNLGNQRKSGLNPPANVPELVKPKNLKDIKESLGYR